MFQINTHTPGRQQSPSVAVDADGDVVVVWPGIDSSGTGIFARRFDSTGVALGAEFQLNVLENDQQTRPEVASEANGDFVVAWESYLQDGSTWGVFARRFNSAGTAIGGEFIVNSHTANEQSEAAIDVDADGDFVIVWQSFLQDGGDYGVFGQRFNSQGARQGPEFLVNQYVTGQQAYSTVGVDANGDFVVAWGSAGQDGSSFGVFARRFDSGGTPLGIEMQVNVYDTGGQYPPSLGLDADGDFVVTWQSNGQDGSGFGIFARHFKATGAPTSGEISVNTTVAGGQFSAAARASASGDFVVVWTSNDASGLGVFGQRFDVPALLDIDGNGQLTALTDGLLVLRFFFGFTGTALTGGAVGPNCMRCDSATILPYLQSLT